MNRLALSSAVGVAVAAVAAWGFWQWAFCRFYVGPNQIAVITAKGGDSLPPGEILAHEGQRGVQEKVLGEGRHFLNPYLYEHRIFPATLIPPGKVGIVTSKVGKELPSGQFLAEAGEKGIWKQVLGPGKYRLNPVGYNVDIVDAISIPVGYAGVITSLSGTQAPEGHFAGPGEKGVRADVLQPGLYYVNPRQFKIDILEVGVNQVALMGKTGGNVITKSQIAMNNSAVNDLQNKLLAKQQLRRQSYLEAEGNSYRAKSSFGDTEKARPERKQPRQAARAGDEGAKRTEPSASGAKLGELAFVLNQFVEFPSKDGFEISLDMTVEFELLPDNLAFIFRNYGDLPAAVEKVIMPQILSISRLKGSAYGARDFIVGEGREKFQNDMTDALARALAEKKIVIHNALIRHVNVPRQILEPIQQASIAQEQDLTNQERQNTAKKQAELNTEISLIDQRSEEVKQETQKLRAEIDADRNKQVAEIGGEALREVAEIEKETAAARAQKTLRLGKAQAEVIRLVEGEKAKGFQVKIKAFGDPVAYNLWTLAQSLNPAIRLNILHSGPGTLWTDLEKAGAAELGGAKLLRQTQKNP